MSSWAGAYGAGAMADSLEKMVAQKFLERKQAEIERAQRVQEQAEQQQLAQTAEHQRQSMGLQYANLAATKDENYQDRTQHVTDTNVRMQRQTLEDQMKAGEKAGDAAREDARTKAGYEHDDARDARNRAFQLHLAGQRSQGSPPTEREQIETERARLQLDGERRAATQASAPAPADTFAKDLDTFSTSVYNHPGLSSAGAGLNIGRSYNGNFGNLKGAAAQLTNLYLNDPEVKAKIAAMKPATDADVQRALSQAVNVDIENMDATAIKSEIDRLRAKAGLKPLGGAPSAEGGPKVMTKNQRNNRTGQTRTVTSTDGGATWH